MGQIRDWKKKKVQAKGQLPLDSLSEKEVRHLVERLLLQNPDMLPKALRLTNLSVTDEMLLPGEGDLDPAQTLAYTPAGYSQAVIRYLEDEHQAPPDFTDHEALTPDGIVPDPVVESEALGGKAFIHLKWTPVAHPHKFQYDVHISSSAAFTPSDLTKVTTTTGDQVWIRALPSGTPLQYGTTYYMQVVSWDSDGFATPSPEVSAALDPNATGDIMAGSITAQQLEAMLVMGTTIIAGNHPPGSRVEFGLTEHDDQEMIGLHAFDQENMLTFMIDANTGMVTMYGTVFFGMGSQLMPNDVIQLLEQPIGFQIPTLVQSSSGKQISGTTVSANWNFATTTNNALFMLVSVRDTDGTAPTPSAPSGWTTVVSKQSGALSMVLFRVNSGASRSGTETVTFGDTCAGNLQLLEYSGVALGAADETATSNGTGTAWSVGPTAATDTNVELCLSMVLGQDTAGPPWTANRELANVTDDFILVRDAGEPVISPQFYRNSNAIIYHKNTSTTGTVDMAGDFSFSHTWLGMVATFRAKVAGLESPDPDHLQIYVEETGTTNALHTINDDGQPHSVALAPPLQQWEFQYYTASLNPPSVAAHSGNTSNLTVTGVLVGDIVVGCHVADPGNRGIHFFANPTVTTNDQITLWYFNTDTVALDHGSLTFHFVVLRRTQ